MKYDILAILCLFLIYTLGKKATESFQMDFHGIKAELASGEPVLKKIHHSI